MGFLRAYRRTTRWHWIDRNDDSQSDEREEEEEEEEGRSSQQRISAAQEDHKWIHSPNLGEMYSWVARHASENINRLPFKKLSQEMEML